jgi:hypothetical protein
MVTLDEGFESEGCFLLFGSFLVLLLLTMGPHRSPSGRAVISKATMSDNTQTRVLFLVATLLSDSLDWLCKLQTTTRSTAPPVDWHSASDSCFSFPRITAHLCFARHYAVGVMDRNKWDDPHLPHLERFEKARFWEHLGSSCNPRKGEEWGHKDIRSIEAIEFLGWTDKTNDTISERIFHIP